MRNIKKIDNYNMLDNEEKSFLDMFEEGKLKQVNYVISEVNEATLAAKNYLRKKIF